MRFLLYTALSISLLLIIMHAAATLKDWNGYKGYIIQELEKVYDAKIDIGGKVEVSLITPKLTINNVYIQHNQNKEQKLSDLINVSKIEVRPSFLSLFLFSLQPKSITLLGMKSNKENLLNVINAKANNSIIDVAIKDSYINLKNNSSDYGNILEIKEIIVKKNRHFFGEVKIGGNYYDFSGKINITKKDVNINVESNFINLLFIGSRNQEELHGHLTLTINNNSDSISDLVRIINLNCLSYVIPSEDIMISSNISINENGFAVNDLEINSKSIQARGKIQNNKKDNHTNVNISFNKVDLDFIHSASKKTADIKELLECFREVVPKNLNLSFNMEASNIRYQKKILDTFHAVLKFADGKVKVNTVLKFPGINNISSLSGKVSNNNNMSEFNGDLLVEGNDFESFVSCFFPFIKLNKKQKNQFSLRSKLHLAPRILSISEMMLLNDEEFLDGSFKVSHTKKRNVIDGGFSLHNLNADKYDYSLFSNLSKIGWLESLKYDGNIKISVNNLTLNNTKIKGLDFLLNIEKGQLAANKIKLYGDDFDVTGSAKILIDQQYAKPLLEINLMGSKFDGNIFKLPNLLEKKRNSRNEINQIGWSTEQFNFLDDKVNFDTNVQLNITEFKTEQSVLKDFNLDAVMRNNTITIRQINYALEHGQMFFQGYLQSDSMHIKFFIANLDAKEIGKVIEINNINGQVSLSGEIKTQGKSFHDWANNLSGDVNLQAQGIEFTNVDFNSFITNLLSSKNKSEISTFAHVVIYNGRTFFENVSGKANISNGTCSISLQFGIDQASGSVSSNLTLSNFALISIFRFFFIPPGKSSPIYLDMHLDGPLWRPKMSFDIDQIFITLIGERNG
jgi:hypothetical protein